MEKPSRGVLIVNSLEKDDEPTYHVSGRVDIENLDLSATLFYYYLMVTHYEMTSISIISIELVFLKPHTIFHMFANFVSPCYILFLLSQKYPNLTVYSSVLFGSQYVRPGFNVGLTSCARILLATRHANELSTRRINTNAMHFGLWKFCNLIAPNYEFSSTNAFLS